MIAVLLCIGVMLFVGCVYSPLLTAGFADVNDGRYLYGPVRIWSPQWSWTAVARMFRFDRVFDPAGTGGYYQPLTAVSHRLDAWLSYRTSSDGIGVQALDSFARAFQFHLTNLALHIANVGLVFYLVRRLSKGYVWPVLASLVFACHPGQVETVASIAQRMTLLGGLFSLLSLVCYVHARASRFAATWMIFATVAYAAAMLCRPLFIALPVVMLALDIWPFRRAGWQPFVEKAPMFAVLISTAVIQSLARATLNAPKPYVDGGVELVTHNLASLAARVVWPFGLSPYQPPGVSVAGLSLGPVFDGIVIAGLLAGLIWSLRRSKPVFAGLTGAVLLMMPALLEAPYTLCLLSDQYLYGALIIPAVVFAAWIAERNLHLSRTSGRWMAIGLAALVAVFSVHAYAMTPDWQSSRTLYERTVAVHPNWMPGHIGLVESLIEENEFDLALLRARQAASIAPDNPSMQFYLGTILLLSDDSRAAEAIEPLRKALRSDPNWITCLQNLGVAMVRAGHDEEAIVHLEKARDLQPGSAGIRLGLGNAYLKVQRFASARREFQEALKRRNDPMAHLGLAIAWAANDELDYARRHLEAAVAKDPHYAVRAGRSPELRRLLDVPGFDGLIEISDDQGAASNSATESPTARRANGL